MRRLLEEPRWSLEKCTDLGGFPWDVVSTEGQRLEREVVSGADLEPLQLPSVPMTATVRPEREMCVTEADVECARSCR